MKADGWDVAYAGTLNSCGQRKDRLLAFLRQGQNEEIITDAKKNVI